MKENPLDWFLGDGLFWGVSSPEFWLSVALMSTHEQTAIALQLRKAEGE